MAEVDLSELTAVLEEHSQGRLGEERAKKIQALAKGTLDITPASAVCISTANTGPLHPTA